MVHFDEAKIRMVLEKPEAYMGGWPHRRIIFRMLQGLYKRQTSLEKATDRTVTDNGMGFNGLDASFLSSVARDSLRFGDLTISQARAVAKTLKKYVRQLVEIANEHQEVKAPVPKPGKKKPVPEQQRLFKQDAAVHYPD